MAEYRIVIDIDAPPDAGAVTSTTLASELFTVEDGHIVEIRLAFDRLGYVPPEQRTA